MSDQLPVKRRSPLRWIIPLFLVLVICYFGSAYLCFWRFTEALKARDRDALVFYVDFRGVRESLKKQWHARLDQPGGSKADRIASMLNAFAPSLIDQLIDAFVTPDGLVSLLDHPQAARDPKELAAIDRSAGNIHVDVSNLRHAWFGGVRDFVVEHEGVKLRFRFSKWRWRLLEIDLGLTSNAG